MKKKKVSKSIFIDIEDPTESSQSSSDTGVMKEEKCSLQPGDWRKDEKSWLKTVLVKKPLTK